jgi:hypothetical protein
VGTALIPLQATRQIFCHSLQTRSEEALNQRVEQFELMVGKNRFKGAQAAKTLPVLFDRLLSNYAPTRNEYIVMLIGDQIYKTSSPLPQDFVQIETIQTWKKNGLSSRGSLSISNQNLNYAVEPITLGGKTAHIIAIHNTSVEFQAIDRSIALVTQVALMTLALCLALTWIMTGKILAPLKLLTTTAQSITESDMTAHLSPRA